MVHLEDGAEVGNECNNYRIELELPEWHAFTNNQLLILRENKASDHSSFDRITEFSIRALELSSCFDQVGNYYRWFNVDKKSQLKEDVLELLSLDFFESPWINGQCRITYVRRKATKEVIDWIDDAIVHDLDYNYVTNGESDIVALFHAISNSVQNNSDNENYYS